MEDLRFKAINTGCSTMWNITPSMCKLITTKKADDVVYTLTDYRKDKKYDEELIDILLKNYKCVYFWPQGAYDYDYLMTFNNVDKIKIISPTFENYSEFLNNNDVDYVGTRLHAGIYAIKSGKRAIILVVDNRTRDMKESYNLNVLERYDIKSNLEKMINSEIITNITMNFDNINKWKEQFK